MYMYIYIYVYIYRYMYIYIYVCFYHVVRFFFLSALLGCKGAVSFAQRRLEGVLVKMPTWPQELL